MTPPTATAEIEIDLRAEVLGVAEFTPALIDRIADHADSPCGTLRETVAALIDIHRGSNDDKRQLKEKYGRMRIELRSTCRGLALGCRGVPADSLLHGTIPCRQQRQISQAVRDLVLPPAPPEGVEEASAAVSAHVKRFVARTPLLSQAPRPRSFVWGGHSIGREEYDFAKECGYWDALGNGTEFITGCGPGVMKAPFKGAVIAYGKQDFVERRVHRDYIGFTERGIIAAEAPNGIVSELVIFPDVEKRMEAFIRCAHRGRVHPGGAGTLEELLTFLGVKSHPNNRDLLYPFDLVERTGGSYMERIVGWLRHCFGDTLDGLYHVHVGEPRRYAEHVRETNRDLDATRLWNDELYFPTEMQHPFQVTFESLEGLDLSRDQEPFSLLVNLRRLFSSLVHLAVKQPDLVESWGDERPLIRGDRDILHATDELIRGFAADQRMTLRGAYRPPYRLE